jgi:hypothetical protein
MDDAGRSTHSPKKGQRRLGLSNHALLCLLNNDEDDDDVADCDYDGGGV